MSTSINRLPDEILAKILNRLSLQELAPLDLVSHRWKSVQEYVLKQINSLTLYKEEFAWKYPDFYELMFFEPLHYIPRNNKNSLIDPYFCDDDERDQANKSEINIPEREWLVRKLPNITKLSMWESSFHKDDLQYLFDHWPKLEQLNISHGKMVHIDEPQFNQLSSLKHLGLFDEIFIGIFYRQELELLPQLETFCLNCPIPISTLNHIFTNLGPHIRHLMLNDFECTPEAMENIRNCLQKNEALASALSTQVTRLTLQVNENKTVDVPIKLQALNFIVKHFGALTHLDLCLDANLYLSDIIGPLSRLERLTSLRLSSLPTGYYLKIFQVKKPLTTGISSVRTLHLSIQSNERNDDSNAPNTAFYQKHLPVAFPQLRELRFENSIQMYYCFDCKSKDVVRLPPSIMGDRLFDGGLLCKCPQKLWKTFRKMKLRSVYRNTRLVYEYKFDCFEQFAFPLERFGQTLYNRVSTYLVCHESNSQLSLV